MQLTINLEFLWKIITEWYWLPLTIIYISIIFTILIENKNPTKTIAWILIIVFLPIVGIILYYFFGQDFKKDKYFQKINKDEIEKFLKYWESLNHTITNDLQKIENKIGSSAKVYQYLNHSLSSPPFMHNKVKLLINGENKFPEFLKALESAKHHIHLEYYIFEEDTIGNQIIDILIKKAEEGVEVRIMTDDFGSPKFNKHISKRFLNTKVKYKTFLPVQFTSLADSNFRNHRKVLIVDANIAFVGGINISDKYINDGKQKLYWRDTSVKIEGSSINMLQLRFWRDWQLATGKNDQFNIQSYDYIKLHDNLGDATVSYGFTTPGAKIQSAVESIILAISLAKKKIRLTTPYFIPSSEFTSAILIAANSGLEVELILPKSGDSYIVQEASFSYTKKIMEHDVKVYLYEKGFIHAKTITIDDDLAFIGTVNLDNRSFYINFELTAIIQDKELIKELNEQFEIDVQDSSLLTYDLWINQPIHRKAFASVYRLLAPIL